MHLRTKRTVIVGVALAALLTMPTSALANGATHGKGAKGVAPIQGVVTSVAGSTLKVQTKTGNVPVALGTSTRVTRLSTLSLSDLTATIEVHLTINKSTNAVNAIQVSGGDKKSGAQHSGGASKPKSTNHVSTKTSKHSKAAVGSHSIADGQVKSVSKNSITITGRNGQSATYAVATNVSITKVVPASLTDLATGQTVQIRQAIRNGKTLASILILKG